MPHIEPASIDFTPDVRETLLKNSSRNRLPKNGEMIKMKIV